MRPTTQKSVWADVIVLLLRHREFLGRWGVWLALAGFLVLETLGHAVALLVESLGDPLLDWAGWHPSTKLAEAAIHLLAPVAIFIAAVLGLGWYRKRVELPQPEAPAAQGVFPHAGLIASLSLLNVPGSRDPGSAAAVRAALAAAAVSTAGSGPNHRDHLLKLLYGTNWGPLAGAVELHGKRLQHVWLLCSRAVEGDVDLVRRWTAFLSGGRVTVEPVPVTETNDAREVRTLVNSLYAECVPNTGLRENQVIADITSGTAAMTAGIVLATLEEHRHVQYLRQGPRSLIDAGEPRRDLETVFEYIHTSPADVARAFTSYIEQRTGTPPAG